MASSGVLDAHPAQLATRLLFVAPMPVAGGHPSSSFLASRAAPPPRPLAHPPAGAAIAARSSLRMASASSAAPPGDAAVGAAGGVVAEASAQLPAAAVVYGSVPAGLRGTLLRMVPANPEHLAAHPPLAPEDGDGHVVAVSFYSAADVPTAAAPDGGADTPVAAAGGAPASADDAAATTVAEATGTTRVFARNRFVRTSAYNKESKLRRRRYRSRLATPATGGWTANLLSVTAKRSAAQQVVAHAKSVLAFADRGLPYMVDGGTLVTRGPAVLAGSLSDDSEDLPVGNCVLSGPVPLPATGGVALLTGRRTTGDDLRGGYAVAYDEAFKPVVRSRAFGLTTRLPLLSFGVTDDWFIIPQTPSGVRGNAVATAVAGRCDGDVVTWAGASAGAAKGGSGGDGGGKAAAAAPGAVTFTFVPWGKPAEVKARVIPLTDGTGAVLEVANAFASATDAGTPVVVVDAVAITPPPRDGGYTLLELTDHLGQRRAAGGAPTAPWPAVLTRYVFDVAADALLSTTPLTPPTVAVYTPVVAPDASTRPHSAVYVNGWDAAAGRGVLLRVDTGAVPAGGAAAAAAAPPVAAWTADAADTRVGSPVLSADGRWVVAPLGGGRLGIWSTAAGAGGGGGLDLQCILDVAAYGLSDGGVSGAWTERVWTAEECATRKKTAYEIFQAKGWNSVDSSFSGLGLNQL